jgi:LuxR family maltose regulon positive regulatory protein
MSVTILSTKLQIPRAHRALVQRPHLLARLDACLAQSATPASPAFACKLTVVSAPAGFGKTTLLSEWSRSLRAAPSALLVAWLSLDEEDEDPVTYWTYLLGALQSVDASLGHDVGQLL